MKIIEQNTKIMFSIDGEISLVLVVQMFESLIVRLEFLEDEQQSLKEEFCSRIDLRELSGDKSSERKARQ